MRAPVLLKCNPQSCSRLADQKAGSLETCIVGSGV